MTNKSLFEPYDGYRNVDLHFLNLFNLENNQDVMALKNLMMSDTYYGKLIKVILEKHIKFYKETIINEKYLKKKLIEIAVIDKNFLMVKYLFNKYQYKQINGDATSIVFKYGTGEEWEEPREEEEEEEEPETKELALEPIDNLSRTIKRVYPEYDNPIAFEPVDYRTIERVYPEQDNPIYANYEDYEFNDKHLALKQVDYEEKLELIELACESTLEILKYLIEEQKYQFAKNQTCNGFYHAADVEIAKFLIEFGVSQDPMKDVLNTTQNLINHGNLIILEWFLKDQFTQTTLIKLTHGAISQSQYEIAIWLIKNKITDNKLLIKNKYEFYSSLSVNNNVELFNLIRSQIPYNHTEILIICFSGDNIDIFQHIYQEYNNINFIPYIIGYNSLKIFKFCLQIFKYNNDVLKHILIYSLQMGRSAVIDFLLKEYPDIVEITESILKTCVRNRLSKIFFKFYQFEILNKRALYLDMFEWIMEFEIGKIIDYVNFYFKIFIEDEKDFYMRKCFLKICIHNEQRIVRQILKFDPTIINYVDLNFIQILKEKYSFTTIIELSNNKDINKEMIESLNKSSGENFNVSEIFKVMNDLQNYNYYYY